jgi:hypothetical protein
MHFVLTVNATGMLLHTVASTRDEALDQFGKVLGKKLTDKSTGYMSAMRLDQYESTPHWINAQIPIWDQDKHGVLA